MAQGDQRVLLGEPAQREVQCARFDTGSGDHHRLQGGRREELSVLLAGLPERVADADVRQPPQPGDPARRHRVRACVRAVAEDADAGDPALRRPVAAERDPVAGSQRSGVHAGVGDLLPRRSALHLEHRAGHRAAGVAAGRRQQFLEPGEQFFDAGARGGGAEEDGVDERRPGLLDEGRAQPGGGEGAGHVGGDQLVVVVGEDVGGGRREAGHEAGLAGSEPAGGAQGDDRGGEACRDVAEQFRLPRAAPVDLVDEEQGRDVQPPQGPHQHPRLRLHPLDGGDDQHGAVQHAEHPFHLGDEVRVAGRVQEVDRHVVERERDDGGLDGDAAPAFQREGVGGGAAGVDAADLVDHSGRVQQPLGQAGLTGVDMGEDSQIEHVHEASCPSESGVFLPGGT